MFTNELDFQYIAKVLSELLSRQYDREIVITMTKKNIKEKEDEKDC